MAGCFGNRFFDREMERRLIRHLDEESMFVCPDCGFECSEDDERLGFDEETNQPICPSDILSRLKTGRFSAQAQAATGKGGLTSANRTVDAPTVLMFFAAFSSLSCMV